MKWHCRKKALIYLMLVLTWMMLLSIKYVVNGISHNYTIQCISKEREALLVFKQGIQVDGCGLLTSWDEQPLDCCEWHGITCDHLTGHVIHLHLSGFDYDYCLEGKISPSLLELKHLKYLDLSGNYFNYQPIPNFIGSLTNLEYLNLSFNYFWSEIPGQLANLSSLISLDLSFNFLQGPSIPSFIGSLTNLEYLNLAYNHFDGEIPHQLANLSSLTLLDLSYNFDYYNERGLSVKSLGWVSRLLMLREVRLNGVDLSAATEWMQIISKLPLLRVLEMHRCGLSPPLVYVNISTTTLTVLDLGANNLNDSSVFQWVFNLSRLGARLVFLDLSFNGIQGPIPEAISNLKHLVYLDLSYNNFQGYIPKRLGDLCSLQTLYLMDNHLTEELSNIIQSLSGCAQKSLFTLDLWGNQVWGSIPESIISFSSLRELYLGYNKLNGTISQSLGQLSMLETLDLSSNCLKGTLSKHHFLNLSRLSDLVLSDNPELLVGITTNWIPPFQLNYISMSSCKLGPYFPNWLLTQKNLTYLDISNSGISDTLPLSPWNTFSSDFNYLNVSHNNIYGVLPPMALSFSSDTIDFSYNRIEGVIPVSLKDLEQLLLNNNMFNDSTALLCQKNKVAINYLDLSNNLLSGKLPDCWNHNHSISVLNLENNHFTGKLPTSIGELTYITELYLRNNSFVGELPRSLENCTSLALLDVSHNALSGKVPPGIGNLKQLSILDMQSNQLRGIIPLSLCQLSHLQILDLSINHISGIIPNCIFNLTAMMNATNSLSMHPDFSFSNIKDGATIMWKREERSFWDALGLVKLIAISDNQLQGRIPVGMSSLRGLVSLDLSINNLTGTIPTDIGQLKYLEFLDLSSNHLLGEIPTSLADVSSLGNLNLSNNNLTGRIPLGTQLQGFDPAVYMGNHGLCGPPLSKCPGDVPNNLPKGVGIIEEEEEEDNESGDIVLGFYISAILGFIIGFWGVCGSLVIKRSWRHAYFRFLGDMKDKLHVMVVVSIAKVGRRS